MASSALELPPLHALACRPTRDEDNDIATVVTDDLSLAIAIYTRTRSFPFTISIVFISFFFSNSFVDMYRVAAVYVQVDEYVSSLIPCFPTANATLMSFHQIRLLDRTVC